MVDLQSIFDRTENINFSKEVQYTSQQGIIGKASLAAGAENLKVYPLTIKLHYSFCTPAEVIEEIEQKIADKEIIDYFQGSEYIGKYVITKADVDVMELIDGNITACTLNVELLESGEENEDFEQQEVDETAEGLEGNTDSADTYTSVSSKVTNYVKTQAANIKESAISAISDIITNGDFSSGTALTAAKGIVEKITADVEDDGIVNIKSITEGYTENLSVANLTDEENQSLIDALNEIPGNVLDTVLRG